MRDKLEKSLHAGSIATALGAAATAADITLFGGAGTLIGMALAGLSIFKKADKDTKDMANLMAPALAEELRRAPVSDDQKKIVIELLRDHPPTFPDIAQGSHIAAQIAQAKRNALADQLTDPAQTAGKVMTTFEVVLAAALEPVVTPTDQQTADAAAILQRLEADGEFKRMRDEGITERAIIRLAKRVTQDTQDLSSAWAAIEDTVATAIRVQQEGHAPSNHRDFVDEVFARTAELAAEGNYVAALDEVNAALDEGAARKLRLLKRGLDMARLAGNAKQAAEFEVARLKLEETPTSLFNALRDRQDEWYVQGRVAGLAFDAMVAIDLAQASVDLATTPDQRGAALNDHGIALRTLGERDSDTKRLNQAIIAFRDALKERTSKKVPLEWAATQNNLGTALQALGVRDSDTKRLNEAVTAFRNALKEYTREKVPLDWATTQNNLGTALQALGKRDSDTKRLNEAVTAFRDALKERTRETVPLDWAMTQNNLGNALRALGEREVKWLQEAADVLRSVLSFLEDKHEPNLYDSASENLAKVLKLIDEESGDEVLEAGTPLSNASILEFDFDAAKKWLRAVGFDDDLAHLKDEQRISIFLDDIDELKAGLVDFIDFARDLNVDGNRTVSLVRVAERIQSELERTKDNVHLRPRRLIELGSYFQGFSLEEGQRASLGETLSLMADDTAERLHMVFVKNFGPSLEKLSALNELNIETENANEIISALQRALGVARNADGSELARLDPEAIAVLEQMIFNLEMTRGQLAEANSSEQQRALKKRLAKEAGAAAATFGRYVEKGQKYAEKPAKWVDAVLKQFKRAKGLGDLWEFLEKLLQGGGPPT